MLVRALYLPGLVALLDDGRVAPIVKLMDAWGNDTIDITDAATIVCGVGGEYVSCQVHGMPQVTVH